MQDLEKNSIQRLLQQYFPQLSELALQKEIVKHGQLHQLRTGDLLIDYGRYVTMVPLMIQGSIKITREDENGNELFLYYLRAKEVCSMSFSCCIAYKRSFIKAVVEEDAQLIGIPIAQVNDWMIKFKTWKNFVMTAYDQRLYDLVQVIDSIAFQKMDERLLNYLKTKSEVTNSKLIQTTHQAIAYDLNASREAISRLLKRLEKDGIIRLGRNQIELI